MKSTKARDDDAAGVVPKALRVLETVAERKRPMSIAEIASALDMPQPTIHRLVGTLEKLGFVGRGEGIAAIATASVVYPGEVPA